MTRFFINVADFVIMFINSFKPSALMTILKWPRKITVVRHAQSEQNVALDLLEPNLDEILAKQKK